jgi:hypothetical protein
LGGQDSYLLAELGSIYKLKVKPDITVRAADHLVSIVDAKLLHFGTALKVTNNQQLDFHVGVGLTPAAADCIIGFGYSFRFFAK